jgi:uncharacterized RDD family membrane protein YckC
MAFCTRCGTSVADADEFCANCGGRVHSAYAEPASAMAAAPAMQRAVHSAYPEQAGGMAAQRETGAFRYGGFWIRLLALLIDSVVLTLLDAIGGFIVGAVIGILIAAATSGGATPGTYRSAGVFIGFVTSNIISWLYFALFESSRLRGTPGKRALGLAVVDLNGQRISFGRASGRYFAKILSGLILGIGYIMAAFSEKKRALHDRLAETYVIRA